MNLFVISDTTLHHPTLQMEVCDVMQYRSHIRNPFSDAQPGFIGKTFQQKIGHPNIFNYLWDGCVLTRLTGKLKTQDMQKDYILARQDFEPFQKSYYSKKAARCVSYAVVLLIITVLLMTGSVKSANAYHDGTLTNKHLLINILTLFGATICTGLLVYLLLPKVDTGRGFHRFSHLRHSRTMQMVAMVLASEQEDLPSCDREQAQTIINEFLTEPLINPYENQPIHIDDSPGNYTLHKQQGKYILRTYDNAGFPIDYISAEPPQQ